MRMVEKSINFIFRTSETGKIYDPLKLTTIILILKKYGYDDTIVSAGLLSQVVKNGDYSISEIGELFGGRMSSLLLTTSFSGDDLPLIEKKRQFSKIIDGLPNDNKAVIGALLIQELEEIRMSLRLNKPVLLENKKELELYYKSLYDSLYKDADDKLLSLLDRYINVFYDVFYGLSVKDEKFYENRLDALNRSSSYIESLGRLKDVVRSNKDYLIEFTGSDDTNTQSIRALENFLKDDSFRVKVEEQGSHSKYTKEHIKSTKSLSMVEKNLLVASALNKSLMSDIVGDKRILICNATLFELLTYYKICYDKGIINDDDLKYYLAEYGFDIQEVFDYVSLCYKNNTLGDVQKSDGAITDDYRDVLEQCQNLVSGNDVVDVSKLNTGDATVMVATNLLPIMTGTYALKLRKFLVESKKAND